MIQLDPTPEEKRHAREALLRWLADPANDWQPQRWVAGLVQLAPTAEDKLQAREALLRLLASQTKDWVAAALIGGLAQLEPTAQDLSTWPTWAIPPTAELLARARRNSPLAVWLEALPSLASLPR